jgi:ABC-type Mn2+/Zn2+ transport system ATPase subunit
VSLRVEQLAVARDQRCVVSEATLSLAAGESAALIGPNGGGKTTLLLAILGWIESTGDIRVCGEAPDVARRRAMVGYVPQRPEASSLPVTPRQAVRLCAGTTRLDRVRADEILERCLGPDSAAAGLPMSRLSGGQLQQVFLARALATRPQLLLLDEPTVGLDTTAVARLVDVLAEAARAGVGVLVATHDHLVAMRLTNRVAYLDRTIRYDGPVDTIPHHLDARLCHHE